MILFTGDLTQKAQAKEFDTFDTILQRIRNAIEEAGGGSPAFLAVPGNHDLDRSAANSNVAAVSMLKDLDRDSDLRDTFWKDRKNAYRKTISKAFQRWTAWSDKKIDWGSFADVVREGAEHPGEFAVTYEGDCFRVGFLGLNTAATQLTEGDYEGKLTLSGLQANSLLNRPYEWSKQHDACFLLTHHPSKWLDSAGQHAYRNEVANPEWFDLHLCGHCHAQERVRVTRGGQSQLRLSVGRSLFGLEEFGESSGKKSRLFGFSFGQMSFGETRQVRLWPRANQDKQGGTWVIEEDHSELGLDGRDQGTPPDDLGRSRRNKVTTRSDSMTASLPTGWFAVDASFLQAAASDIRSDDLAVYFDGDDPQLSTPT